jgi:DNA replication protein DnaC
MKKPSLSLDSLFSGLVQQAEKREEEPHEEADPAALLTQEIEAQCQCDGTRKYFISRAPGRGKLFAPCPACNPRLKCPKCEGSGNLHRYNLMLKKDDITPNACECTALERKIARLNSAGLPVKYLCADFSGFEDDKGISQSTSEKLVENQRTIFEFCAQVHDILIHGVEPGDKYFLTLMGPVGTGKTHLGVAALKRLALVYNHSVRFIDFQALLYELRDAFETNRPKEQILGPLRETEVLLIDEFGKGRARNEFQMETLDELVNSRYNCGLATIITTNYLPKKLHQIWLDKLGAQEKGMYIKNKVDENKMFLPEGLSDFMGSNSVQSPINETFWLQTLEERIGSRMFDRILEASIFVDFLDIPSFREVSSRNFLNRYQSAHKE